MKRTILAAGASALGLVLGLSTTASADDSGWYLRANAGIGSHLEPGLSGGIDSSAHTGDFNSESDIAYSLGAGYEFDDNWRIELDGDSLFTELGAIGGASNSFGKLRTNSLMLNLIYDFANDSAIEPYVGMGLGLVSGEGTFVAHDIAVGANAIANPVCPGTRAAGQVFSCDISDTAETFGWQALAGLGIKISDNLTWDNHVSYMDAGTLDMEGLRSVISLGNVDQSRLVADLRDVERLTAMTGLRYRFGDSTPPPPPPPPPLPPQPITYTCFDGSVVTDRALCPTPPPPPPVESTFTCEGSGQVVTDLALCPPRTECPDGSIVYGPIEFCPTRTGETQAALCGEQFRQEVIYYEFDRGQSAETRNTINRILDVSDFCQVDNIRVVGHTDTSGSAAYNLSLSKRRAKDALDELVRQGVNRQIITSEGKGETENFVDRGDGVKEPLNRRTEVLIQLSEVGTGSMFNN